MMTYEDLIVIFSELVNNDKIKKEGLIMFYELPEENHRKLDEHLFYKTNDRNAKFEHQEIIEVDVDGFIVKIIKEGGKLIYKDLED
jgi:hypothetical protein